MQTRKSIVRIGSLARVFTLLALAFGAAGVTPACAETFIVTNSADRGPGTLRQAIVDIGDGGLITFDDSLSGGTIYLASQLTINKSLTINGSALASKITLSGDGDGDGLPNVRVLYIPGIAPGIVTTVILNGLIITKGKANGGGIYNKAHLTVMNSTVAENSAVGGFAEGGGISNEGDLTLVNVTISGNTSSRLSSGKGGGISNYSGLINMSLVTLSGNTAGKGGGIYNYGGTISITNSLLSGNTANNVDGGGAIYNAQGAVTLTRSTVSDNHVSPFYHGGGIFNGGGVATLNIMSSTLSGNSAGSGGAISNSSSLTVTNSTISGNEASFYGGGIMNDVLGEQSGVATVYSTSIVDNVADSNGDGIGSGGGVYNDGTFSMRNTLIAGNRVGVVSSIPVYDNCWGTIESYALNLIGAWDEERNSGSCRIEGERDFLNGLSLLGPLQNNGGPTRTIALLPGSNAIDGASIGGCIDTNGGVLTADQRGVVRPKGLRCDVGAYELAPDTDGDGLADELDNCTLVANATQLDTNRDGYGNICDPDFNNNGIVDSQDGALLKAAFGSGGFPDRDLNGNGIVDSNDGARLKARFGQAPGPSGLRP